jgi:hypothetical protein
MLDPRFTLHEKVISTIERIMPPDKNPDLDPGFLNFRDTKRVPIEQNPSSFEADQLKLNGFTSFFDVHSDEIRKVLFHVEIILFKDSSPYEREQDWTDRYWGGLHSIIVGDDIPPTLVSRDGSEKIHDDPNLLGECLRNNVSEIITIEQARAVEVALGALTTANIDYHESI